MYLHQHEFTWIHVHVGTLEVVYLHQHEFTWTHVHVGTLAVAYLHQHVSKEIIIGNNYFSSLDYRN